VLPFESVHENRERGDNIRAHNESSQPLRIGGTCHAEPLPHNLIVVRHVQQLRFLESEDRVLFLRHGESMRQTTDIPDETTKSPSLAAVLWR
jgi:hypothetical protein